MRARYRDIKARPRTLTPALLAGRKAVEKLKTLGITDKKILHNALNRARKRVERRQNGVREMIRRAPEEARKLANARGRLRYSENIERERARSRLRRAEHPRYVTDYCNARRKRDPLFAMTCRLRHSVHMRLGASKPARTDEILRCSFSFFKNWIQSHFSNGMTWRNRHRWHIDHIFPVNACASLDDVAKSFFYRNLRPAWSGYNSHQKKDRITDDGLIAAYLCGISVISLKRDWQMPQAIQDTAEACGFTVIRRYAS